MRHASGPKNLFCEFCGDTYSFVLMDIMNVYGYYETDANHDHARFSRCKVIGFPKGSHMYRLYSLVLLVEH